MSHDLPVALAALHAEAFDAPWSAEAFAGLLAQPGMILETDPSGFILVRVVVDEAEILTLAVRPSARRQGIGGRLVTAAAARARAAGAERLFLEAAEDNRAARALYAGSGFTFSGRRRGYYAREDGPAVDAVLMTLALI